MTSRQYEEPCRFFIADQLQMPVEHVLSLEIPGAGRGGIGRYSHQIDLLWVTGNNVTRYVNIANAKWRCTYAKVRQADVLLPGKVKEKVGAHKAVLITCNGYTREAGAIARDEGIALIMVQPAFNARQLARYDRRVIIDQIQELARTSKDIYMHQIEDQTRAVRRAIIDRSQFCICSSLSTSTRRAQSHEGCTLPQPRPHVRRSATAAGRPPASPDA
jgi:hypothetical protein